ncbi:alpha/beta fold hydrolase [Mycobacterium sp. PS03-16]|uniref:alpha/beta fold hydrolase n=1 Tax=Mycobacterium sp. PS03-16 TaxID=2559611 RepID=UPI0014302A3B|nr:alpha/beta fold hydrolase [Mycobacterium sp. PS03-16]
MNPDESPLEYRSVIAHVEATARRRPDSIAIRTATRSATYAQLLAAVHALTETPPEPGRRRAALLSASLTPATAATILALFASRTVLVAVDPALPANRVRRMSGILEAAGYSVDTARVPADLPTGVVTGAPAAGGAPDDVTSIQFTSGSTGMPKAVLHPNGLWLADAQLLQRRFGMADGRTVALGMPVSFAAGLNVLLGALMGGAEVIAVDPRVTSAVEAFDQIRASGAQVIAATPAFVDALHTAARGATVPTVERIVTTGEPAHARHVRLARAFAPNAVFTNWLGSTEVCGIASHDVAPTAPLPEGALPAGIPTPHKRVEVDADGAISITSHHIGLGYLDGQAAAATFVRNADGSRTYRGGEVGRWDDGILVMRGRADAAVKIRGYLVEPAEIEAALLRYDDVREAAVVTHPASPAALAAYVAPSTTVRTPSVADLRTRLHRDVPPWMVPAHLEVMAALPRTDRGKIDRMALPAPRRGAGQQPRGEWENRIAGLWAEVLHTDAVGRDESFYALGGDSLTVTVMLSRLCRGHGVVLQPSDLASAPSVAQFARKAAAQHTGAVPEGTRLSRTTVALRPASASTGTTLFCFTGAGASSLCFVPLADRVGAGTAVYAFEPKGLEKRALPDLSVRGAARRHVTDLRRIQPHGPYVLVGHSLGAHIALDAARALEAAGESVELLVMLDPWLSPAAVHEARRDVPDARLTLEQTVPTDVRSWWAHQRRLPLAGLLFGGRQRQVDAVEEVGVITGMRHRPQPWAGRALVVMSHLNEDDPRLWRRVLTGELTIERQDCDHHSIVREPHIGAVVELIAQARARATVGQRRAI